MAATISQISAFSIGYRRELTAMRRHRQCRSCLVARRLCRMFTILSPAQQKNALAFPWGAGMSAIVGTEHGTRGLRMLYLAYQTQTDMMAPMRVGVGGARSRRAADLLGDGIHRNSSAVYELISRGGPHAQASALRHRQRPRRQPRGRGDARSRRRARRSARCCISRRTWTTRAAAGPGGGAALGPLRHAAARDGAHHAARARRLHHRLAQCARRAASPHGRFGFDDYVEHLDPLARGARARAPTSSRCASPASRRSRRPP